MTRTCDQDVYLLSCSYATCSHPFMDAYAKGLNGTQAAWAAKKYCSHHTLPNSLMEDLEAAATKAQG
ncbi:hypothetical protein C8Q72DRAFT_780197 [Fomitopsis betulina]|nr:hypothetical protein C8Q72DRAFT_780197 [Fomitopsis betulina]